MTLFAVAFVSRAICGPHVSSCRPVVVHGNGTTIARKSLHRTSRAHTFSAARAAMTSDGTPNANSSCTCADVMLIILVAAKQQAAITDDDALALRP